LKQESVPPVLAPDLPGYGRSRHPERVLGIGELAGWLVRLMDTQGLERVDLMGHSMGCQVALALGASHPDRVGRIVLIGPTTGARHVPLPRELWGLLRDSRVECARYNFRVMRGALRMGIGRYLATVGRMREDDAFAQAGHVVAPCLVVRGEHDRIVPLEVARRLAERLPNGRFAPVAQTPHADQFIRPDEAARIALAFLAR
jgi:2-hydroxy-6-oxonona-2,4-dienedioate hydrolase